MGGPLNRLRWITEMTNRKLFVSIHHFPHLHALTPPSMPRFLRNYVTKNYYHLNKQLLLYFDCHIRK